MARRNGFSSFKSSSSLLFQSLSVLFRQSCRTLKPFVALFRMVLGDIIPTNEASNGFRQALDFATFGLLLQDNQ